MDIREIMMMMVMMTMIIIMLMLTLMLMAMVMMVVMMVMMQLVMAALKVDKDGQVTPGQAELVCVYNSASCTAGNFNHHLLRRGRSSWTHFLTSRSR